ncbi:MAG: Agmatinase [Nitrospira sp.]|nr:MAG: Agmatinase [Nitrospira sp.]
MLKFLQIIADTKPLAGMEIVECSPPYDAAEITSLMATRVICDVLACQVRSGNLIQPKETLRCTDPERMRKQLKGLASLQALQAFPLRKSPSAVNRRSVGMFCARETTSVEDGDFCV